MASIVLTAEQKLSQIQSFPWLFKVYSFISNARSSSLSFEVTSDGVTIVAILNILGGISMFVFDALAVIGANVSAASDEVMMVVSF